MRRGLPSISSLPHSLHGVEKFRTPLRIVAQRLQCRRRLAKFGEDRQRIYVLVGAEHDDEVKHRAPRSRGYVAFYGLSRPTTHIEKNCEPPPYAWPSALPVFSSTW
jgi:hypothetical protein